MNDTHTVMDMKIKLQSLEDYWNKFLEEQLKIDEITGKESIGIQRIAMENGELIYHNTKKILLKRIDENSIKIALDRDSDDDNDTVISINARKLRNDVKLPRIVLPIFSGDYKEWTSFKDLFTSLIRNNEMLSASQKLQYLRSNLTGEAANVIRAFQITDANYEEAWTLLDKRYNHKRFIVESHVKTILGLEKLTTESAKGLRGLVDSIRESTRALTAMDVRVEHWDAILNCIIVNKLDQESHRQWQLTLKAVDDTPKTTDLLDFLDNRWQSLEMLPCNPFSNRSSKQKNSDQRPIKAHQASMEGVSKFGCCGGNHRLHTCGKFIEMSSDQRSKFVICENLCFNCLRTGHSAFKCRASHCQVCNKRHHTILHRTEGTATSSSNNQQSASNKKSSQPSSLNNNQSLATSEIQGNFASTDIRQRNSDVSITTLFTQGETNSRQVLLATAIIILEDNSGVHHEVRALLDSGSEASFIAEECVQRCRLRRSNTQISICGLGTASAGKTRGLVCVKLISKQDPNFAIEVNALILSKLTNTLPNQKIASADWPHLKNIPLADITYGHPGKIDMLLGADVYGDLIINGIIPSINNSPVAQNTNLGWILLGPVTSNQ